MINKDLGEPENNVEKLKVKVNPGFCLPRLSQYSGKPQEILFLRDWAFHDWDSDCLLFWSFLFFRRRYFSTFFTLLPWAFTVATKNSLLWLFFFAFRWEKETNVNTHACKVLFFSFLHLQSKQWFIFFLPSRRIFFFNSFSINFLSSLPVLSWEKGLPEPENL